MKIGEAIAESIREKGMKQNFVAEKAGISAQQLSDVCKGRRRIEALECFKVCDAIGINMSELYQKICREG